MSAQLRNQLSAIAYGELSALAGALVNSTEVPDETPQLGIELMYSLEELFRQAVAMIAEAIEDASDGLKTARPLDPALYLVGMAGTGYAFGICNKEGAPKVLTEHGFDGAFFLPSGGQKLREIELCTPEETKRRRARNRRD